MREKLFLTVLALLLLVAPVFPQKANVTVTLDEQFFEELLSVVFKDDAVLEFSLESPPSSRVTPFLFSSFDSSAVSSSCSEIVKLARPLGDKSKRVRLHEGKIVVPVSFTGTYDPPLLSCFDYSGTSDAEITLDFDEKKQALIGRVRARDITLSGVPGLFSGLVSRMVQRSIDKKVNPIQIIGLDMISMNLPVQEGVEVTMKAIEVKHKIEKGLLTLNITYEFSRK